MKNKTGKIRDITDIAISKISYYRYAGYTDEQNILVHELCTFLLSLSQKNNNSKEIAFVYDLSKFKELNNNILNDVGISYGTTDSVKICEDTKTNSIFCRAKDRTIILIHNHPSCSSFSLDDFNVFLKETSMNNMIAIANNGELYYIQKTDSYTYSQAKDLLKECVYECIPEIKNNPSCFKSYKDLRKAADLFLDQAKSIGIKYEHIITSDRFLQQLSYNYNISLEDVYEQER